MPNSTFRADTRARVVSVLTDFQNAYPNRLRRVWLARPESSPDVPYVYVDLLSEDVTHDSGTRNRNLSGLSFVLVDRITTNIETADRLDETVDLLVDWLTARPQLGGDTGIWSQLRVTDEDAPFGDYDYIGVRFSFPDISIMEGRS